MVTLVNSQFAPHIHITGISIGIIALTNNHMKTFEFGVLSILRLNIVIYKPLSLISFAKLNTFFQSNMLLFNFFKFYIRD